MPIQQILSIWGSYPLQLNKFYHSSDLTFANSTTSGSNPYTKLKSQSLHFPYGPHDHWQENPSQRRDFLENKKLKKTSKYNSSTNPFKKNLKNKNKKFPNHLEQPKKARQVAHK